MLKKIFTNRNLLLFFILSITIVLLFLSYTFYKKYQLEQKKYIAEMNEKIISDSLSKVKYFESKEIPQIGLSKIIVKSKYINSEIRYSFSATFIVDPLGIISKKFPRSISSYRDYLEIKFLDFDEFNIASETIYLRNITYQIDEKGEKVGISFDGKIKIDKSSYMKISNWDLQWSL